MERRNAMKQYPNEYKGKNILVTGGAGCIGSNLTKALVKAEAAKIIILDDLSAAEKWNIPTAPNIVFIQRSILDEEVLKRTYNWFTENSDRIEACARF